MKKLLLIVPLLTLMACNDEPKQVVEDENSNVEIQPEKEEAQVDHLEGTENVDTSLVLNNGIEINWHSRGEGDNIRVGDVIAINYEVKLEDGTIVDGNIATGVKIDSIPFMVGFGMQTKGWDIALQELQEGDFATIKIPSELARGEKGLGDLIPPNADNYLTIRIFGKMKPTKEVDGNKVWRILEDKKETSRFTDTNAVLIHTMAHSKSAGMYHNTWRTNQPFEFKLSDYGVVPGLKKALINAKRSDRLFVYVPAKEAYGTKGYLDIVKPNEPLFYNLLVVDIIEK